MSISTREVGTRLTVPNETRENAVHSLARTLNETAPSERFGDAPIPRLLSVENVFRRDTWREAAGAHDFKAPRKLAHEY